MRKTSIGRIDQVIPDISYGDAVSNHALALRNELRNMGFESDIYALNIAPRLKYIIKEYKNFLAGNSRDVVIYHMATSSEMIFDIGKLKGVAKILNYHNVTPKEFFIGYSDAYFKACEDAREQLKKAKDMFDYSFGDSEYNCIELRELGYKNVKELPILTHYDDYDKEPSEDIVRRFSDGNTNILFLGRIVPNKRQEDVIKSFYYYKRFLDKGSRLFLVGSYEGMELYYKTLKVLVKELELKDVYFTGKVSFEEILAYYRTAHVFLSMSEHEGFCMPLIESMYFGVPIIAYKEAAIPYTLKDAGVMISSKDYLFIAGLLDSIVHDNKLRTSIIDGQSRRLADFSYDRVASLFEENFMDILGVEND